MQLLARLWVTASGRHLNCTVVLFCAAAQSLDVFHFYVA
mgnify:CR=1 FL=1